MENISSEDFQKKFLLFFTRELIRHSGKQDIIKLEKIIEWEEGKKKEKMPSTFEVKTNIPSERLKELKESFKIKKEKQAVSQITKFPEQRQFPRPIARAPLVIPEQRLPAHLEYLKPIPAETVEIDLPKINPLIKDPAVRTIEGNPEENAIVSGTMGTKPTGIMLTKEDVDSIIDKFSKASKIPTTEGVYQVAVGNLIISALISSVVGSRFVIKKMAAQRPPATFQPQSRPQIPISNNFGAQRFF